MAPSVISEPAKYDTPDDHKGSFNANPSAYDQDAEMNGKGGHAAAKYPHYLPVWEFEKYPALEPFEHYEHGKDADPTFPNLLKEGVKVEYITGNMGAEVTGLQLHKLSDKAKDELALFVAKNKCVAFRDQDFADIPIQEAKDWAGYFGRHHMHQISGGAKGFPELHVVHRGAGDTKAADFFKDRTNSTTWHSDITFELQPAGTTILYALECPSHGGETIFANMVEAYNRLSPTFQKRLHGLRAMHSGQAQVDKGIRQGGHVRREAVMNSHPIVRTHPATGEKSLFVNKAFTRRILGMKQEESEYLLKFLFDHIALSADLQCRMRWKPRTVVMWDNRNTGHSALLDWQDGQRRHMARWTLQAEKPYETPFVEPAPGVTTE